MPRCYFHIHDRKILICRKICQESSAATKIQSGFIQGFPPRESSRGGGSIFFTCNPPHSLGKPCSLSARSSSLSPLCGDNVGGLAPFSGPRGAAAEISQLVTGRPDEHADRTEPWRWQQSPTISRANETLITRHIGFCVSSKPPKTHGLEWSSRTPCRPDTYQTEMWCSQSLFINETR